MLLRLLVAPTAAVDGVPYVAPHWVAFPVESISSIQEDTTNRNWTIVFVANAGGTYVKIIVGMNFEQVATAYENACRALFQSKLGNSASLGMQMLLPPGYTGPFEGVGVGAIGLAPSPGDMGANRANTDQARVVPFKGPPEETNAS